MKISPRLLIGLFYIIMVIKLARLLCWLQHFPSLAFVSNSRYFPLFPSYSFPAFLLSSLFPLPKHLLSARLVSFTCMPLTSTWFNLPCLLCPTSSWLCAEKREDINGNYKEWVVCSSVSDCQWNQIKMECNQPIIRMEVNTQRCLSYSPFLACFPSSGGQAWLRAEYRPWDRSLCRPQGLWPAQAAQMVGRVWKVKSARAQVHSPKDPSALQRLKSPLPALLLSPAGVMGTLGFHWVKRLHISSCFV